MAYRAKPLSRVKIRQHVIVLRQTMKEIGYETGVQFPLLKFIEHVLPYVFPEFEFEIVDDNELNCYAKAYPSKNKIVVRNSVYEGACRGNGRDRFTIAHEIGHFFLHGDENVSFARLDETIFPFEDPEWQANTFAGELLVPVDLIKEMSIEEISVKCKVSRQVAEIQKKYC